MGFSGTIPALGVDQGILCQRGGFLRSRMGERQEAWG